MGIPKVKYVNFASKRSFGIELEVNQKVSSADLVKIVLAADPKHKVMHSTTYVQDYNNNYWHVKFDRSCGDIKDQGGWEIASYKASGYKDIINMGKVTDALKKAGVVVNDNCGFHIHAGIPDLNTNKLTSLLAHWVKIEPIIIESLPKHRKNNKYCRLLSSKYDYSIVSQKMFWDLVRPRNFDNADRRVSLNICGYVQGNRETIELRLPECSLSGSDVKNWIRFFVHFVDSVIDKTMPINFDPVDLFGTMKIVGLHNEDPFFILSKALRETKLWFMKRIIDYSTKKKTKLDAIKFINTIVDKH